MPYIKNDRRLKIDPSIEKLIQSILTLDAKDKRDHDGDLNYTICKILIGTLDLKNAPKYTKFNSAIGVLESVKLELYRQLVAPYEDEKIKENGHIV